jgi:E3 ubiquitin-protein ligase UBR4
VVYSRKSRFFCDCGAGSIHGVECQCLTAADAVIAKDAANAAARAACEAADAASEATRLATRGGGIGPVAVADASDSEAEDDWSAAADAKAGADLGPPEAMRARR